MLFLTSNLARVYVDYSIIIRASFVPSWLSKAAILQNKTYVLLEPFKKLSGWNNRNADRILHGFSAGFVSVANTPMRNRLSPFLLYLPTTWILQPLRAYLRAYLRAHFEDIRTIHIATLSPESLQVLSLIPPSTVNPSLRTTFRSSAPQILKNFTSLSIALKKGNTEIFLDRIPIATYLNRVMGVSTAIFNSLF